MQEFTFSLNRNPKIYTSFIFVSLYLFDNFLNKFFESNVIGLILLSVYGLLISLGKSVELKKNVLFIFFFVIFLSLIACIFPNSCSFNLRLIFSLSALGAMLFMLSEVNLTKYILNRNILNSIFILIIFFLFLDLFNFGFQSIFFNEYIEIGNHSGSFSEPSHLAAYLIPIYGYLIISEKMNYLSWISLLVIFILGYSVTLVLGITSFFLLRIINGQKVNDSKNFLLTIFAIVSFMVFIFLTGSFSSIIDRLVSLSISIEPNINPQSHPNLSSLVWMNGWSQAWETAKETNFLGLGFNKMGCESYVNKGFLTELIIWQTGGLTNAFDGSFLASKVIAEFGFFGIITISVLTCFSIVKILRFIFSNKTASPFNKEILILQCVGAICLLIFFFGRNVGGYFNLSLFLVLQMFFYKYFIASKYEKQK